MLIGRTVRRWCAGLGLFWALSIAGWSSAHAVELPGAIVGADWLARNLGAPGLVVVDARLAEDYELGHIAGAVNIPYSKLFADGYLIPGLGEIRELISAAGIGNHSKVVVYDDGEFIWAARAYWLLETFGVEDVALLDVGFGNWAAGVLPESFDAPVVKRSSFVPSIDHRRLQTKLGTLVAIDDPRRVIIDGRSAAEYRGEESLASRYGHVPSAVHYSWSNNYVRTPSGNRMRPLNELAPLYGALERDKPVIVYCNGGAHSALNYIVLQALGYQVSVYDGSWFEWGNDGTLPIVNPSAR
ncbi:sulfurtransferase [Pseudothauera lacus]|uniref:Sulfurtransferase n=1 Tax=Pseudothauera lacus TaxID=2136175 RepID=A0A2T4IHM9_9RHOO|nr:rhodanese-like domain-containing protein [Pseudothauera lacus]PTD97271.1 sulfurtransferase [Pseudothauera lacus]